MQFAGEQTDATGLYYLRARQYDPATGRFTRADPADQTVAGSQISSYAYASDRPTIMTDAGGMMFAPSDAGVDVVGLPMAPVAGTPQCIPLCIPVIIIAVGAAAAATAVAYAWAVNRYLDAAKYPRIKHYDVPSEAYEELEWVIGHNGSPRPGIPGGKPFKNLQGYLPQGTYNEYDIDKRPPKPQRRGLRRIVVDFSKKAAFYSRDHYETFTRMNWPS
jgi:RHS repeat-associated protein